MRERERTASDYDSYWLKQKKNPKPKNKQMIFLPKQDKIDEEDSYIEVYRGKSNKENQSHSLFETAINCLYFSFDTQL